MKTKLLPHAARRPAGPISMFVKLATLMTALLVSTLALSPAAMAGGADGAYKLTRVSGKFVIDGETVTVPASLIKSGFLQNGRLVVKNDKVPIYPKNWADMMENFNYMGFTGSVNVSGPRDLVLKKSGRGYSGSTSRPVVLKISGDYMGTAITMKLTMKFNAKLVGNQLTITAPVKLDAMGLVTMNGTVKMVAKR